LERDLKKIETRKKDDEDEDDDDDDDDIDDTEGIKIELEELTSQNKARHAKLEEYEKNKKWNVDNMFEVKEERTMINPAAGKTNYTPDGFATPTTTGAKPKILEELEKKEAEEAAAAAATTPTNTAAPAAAPTKPAAVATAAKPVVGPAKPPPTTTTVSKYKSSSSSPSGPTKEDMDNKFIYSYHEFTEKYAGLVEEFMACLTFDQSKEFLLKHGAILLQENASNYLLLASLEDEMNGIRDKMRQTAKQSQLISNIAELAKSMNTHPGNVILPFFQRLEQREFLMGFLEGVEAFIKKIISRAVTKKIEMDRERELQQQGNKSAQNEHGVDLEEIPRDERLGPGGLDPLEVIETLPVELQEAFESRDVEKLKDALTKMDPKDAEYHMKRCVDSGLWQAQA
jgi:cell division cycle protein 37